MTKALTKPPKSTLEPARPTHTASMDALQSMLMQTLQGVSDGSIDLSSAKVINQLVQTSFNGAKIEADFMRATQRTNSTFFDPNAAPRTTHRASDVEPPNKIPGTHWQGLTR